MILKEERTQSINQHNIEKVVITVEEWVILPESAAQKSTMVP